MGCPFRSAAEEKAYLEEHGAIPHIQDANNDDGEFEVVGRFGTYTIRINKDKKKSKFINTLASAIRKYIEEDNHDTYTTVNIKASDVSLADILIDESIEIPLETFSEAGLKQLRLRGGFKRVSFKIHNYTILGSNRSTANCQIEYSGGTHKNCSSVFTSISCHVNLQR